MTFMTFLKIYCCFFQIHRHKFPHGNPGYPSGYGLHFSMSFKTLSCFLKIKVLLQTNEDTQIRTGVLPFNTTIFTIKKDNLSQNIEYSM